MLCNCAVEEPLLVAKGKGKVQNVKCCGAYSEQILGTFNYLLFLQGEVACPHMLCAQLLVGWQSSCCGSPVPAALSLQQRSSGHSVVCQGWCGLCECRTATGPEVVLHHGILSYLFVSLHSEFEFSPVPSRKKFAELRKTVTASIWCREHKVFTCGVCTNHWDKVPACFVAVVAAW